MLTVAADEVATLLPWTPLREALADMFRSGCEMPVRHHHSVAVPGEADATLLLMPAWTQGGVIGTKVVTVFPGNADRGIPAVAASYLLASAKTGAMLAMIDGGELTARRTAAASALAASYLARSDARHLLVAGTGRLAPLLAEAHSSVRTFDQVSIWGRNPDKAADVAERLNARGLNAAAAPDLEAATAAADVVTCATLAFDPLIHGDWLRPGTHLDLVGGFTPKMREADDDAIRRATVFLDTRAGATKEAGDIVQPLESGVLLESDIAADLHELCRGEHGGRAHGKEITLFKSVGAALEDLAAALLVYDSRREP